MYRIMTRSIILFLVAARDDSLYTVWQQQQMSEREPSHFYATNKRCEKDMQYIDTRLTDKLLLVGRSVDQGLSSIIHLVSVEN